MTETTLTKSIVEATDSKPEGERAAAVVEKAVETDPVLMNALSQEPWWQSGVQWFGTGGVIWSLSIVAREVGTNGSDIGNYDIRTLVDATGTLAMALGVLYRRFVPGLKPMFHGWFGT